MISLSVNYFYFLSSCRLFRLITIQGILLLFFLSKYTLIHLSKLFFTLQRKICQTFWLHNVVLDNKVSSCSVQYHSLMSSLILQCLDSSSIIYSHPAVQCLLYGFNFVVSVFILQFLIVSSCVYFMYPCNVCGCIQWRLFYKLYNLYGLILLCYYSIVSILLFCSV